MVNAGSAGRSDVFADLNVAGPAEGPLVLAGHAAEIGSVIYRRKRFFRVLTEDGHDLGAPDGAYWFVGARIAFDDSGTLHVVWGEPEVERDKMPPREWLGIDVKSLWHASFAFGRGWTAAERLYEGDLKWRDGTTSGLLVAGDSLMIVTALRSQGALLLSAVDGVWQSRRILQAYGVAYVDAVITSDAFQIVFASAARDQPGFDGNSVFLATVQASGKVGTHLVSRSGRYPAWRPHVFGGNAGLLHLVWLQDLPTGGSAVRHVLSTDGGVSWSPPDDFVREGATRYRFDATMDACGDVHVISQGAPMRSDPGPLEHAIWHEGWANVDSVRADRRIQGAIFARHPNRRVVLALVQPDSGSGGGGFRTSLTTYTHDVAREAK